MTSFTFTANLSPATAFDGEVKIKADDMTDGSYVTILEEKNDGEYEVAVGQSGPLQISFPMTSALFALKGNYKIRRSSDSISVGYEA